MSTVDSLWYLADQATQRAEQAAHDLDSRYEPTLCYERTRTVSRHHFRTLVERIQQSGTPYGTQTIVYRPAGELLLVYHEDADRWVLPGGCGHRGERFRETARRELREEAGIEASYDGLALRADVTVRCGTTETWGVLPIFAAQAETTSIDIDDPDGEISDARWFDELPSDTRDRGEILAWRDRVLS
ncbi:NUDIX hydrolase [Natranaeroarchaeum aerophilus]|uniref:NUDIX domain-containing protein n=1 Tax=Natranaeroarchaeum aerophilus TaxID=2917711 RepID=A0AAE3FPS3_9EURY|nr:NUDIX domain-containing protein [Natranaeroarchaeum aerophilus]MCL9812911.1 NUDIX domain-containing protein [Natranaeroarchaeum aerophilus]